MLPLWPSWRTVQFLAVESATPFGDIDLAYCPIDDREIAVRDITASMQQLAERVKTLFHGASVTLTAANPVPKVFDPTSDGVMVKIEPNATIRGTGGNGSCATSAGSCAPL